MLAEENKYYIESFKEAAYGNAGGAVTAVILFAQGNYNWCSMAIAIMSFVIGYITASYINRIVVYAFRSYILAVYSNKDDGSHEKYIEEYYKLTTYAQQLHTLSLFSFFIGGVFLIIAIALSQA